MSAATEWLATNGYTIQKQQGGGGSGWASFGAIDVVAPDGANRRLFVKSARRSAREMFEGEALGLRALRATKALRIPEVVHFGDEKGGGSFLIMEYLELRGSADPAEFGRAMARLHLAEPSAEEARAGMFGFPVDNTIGGSSQPNTWESDWLTFYRRHRIEHQLRLAGSGELTKLWEAVLDRTSGLSTLFDGVQPIRPSTLHGEPHALAGLCREKGGFLFFLCPSRRREASCFLVCPVALLCC